MIFDIRHKHRWSVKYRSNVIQRDDMGYPLRLCIMECGGCRQTDQQWIDTDERENDVDLKWYGLSDSDW